MTDPQFNVHQALQRVETFRATHAAAFPAGSEGAKNFARVAPLLAEIGQPKQQPGVPASPATAAKADLFAEVRDDLEAIAATARTIAKKEVGFATPYRLGDDSQREILADADRILTELAKPGVKEKFIAYSMDGDFLADLKADLALIGEKSGLQEEHQISSAGGTARVAELVKEARALIGSLDTSVKNLFRRDTETLAQWHTAAHIRRSPRPMPEDNTPVTPPAS